MRKIKQHRKALLGALCLVLVTSGVTAVIMSNLLVGQIVVEEYPLVLSWQNAGPYSGGVYRGVPLSDTLIMDNPSANTYVGCIAQFRVSNGGSMTLGDVEIDVAGFLVVFVEDNGDLVGPSAYSPGSTPGSQESWLITITFDPTCPAGTYTLTIWIDIAT